MPTSWSRVNSWRSSTVFITVVICYAVFVDQVFFAFILPVLPYSLPARNGIAVDRVQYWTTIEIIVFGVACLVSCPLIGWWTDFHHSRRWPFLAGLLVLLAGTLIMWLAKPIGLQIFSRVLQGIADAVIYIVGMAIMIDTVGTTRIAEYMGHVTIALNVGTFAGPLLGGAVFEAGGYHAVWGMMLGIVLVDTLLRLIMAEKQRTGIGTDCEANISTMAAQHASASMENAAPAVRPRPTDHKRTSSVIGKFKVPDIVRLLNSPRMVTACVGVCVQSMVFSGFETVLSIYVQDIWGYNALGAGLLFIPLTIPAFFAPLIGRIVDRTSTRWALTAGFAAMLPVIVLVRFVDHNSIGQKVLMCVFLSIIGLGITVILGPLMAEISHIAEEFVKNRPSIVNSEEDHARGAYAQAYALNAMAWSCGNVAGPLLCGFLKDRHGWATMCWVLGLVSGLAAVPCFIWSGRPSASQIWRVRVEQPKSSHGEI